MENIKEELKERIAKEGIVLSDKIIAVNSFINHQIDCVLMDKIGNEFAVFFKDKCATKVLTAEASGIPPALATGMKLSIPVIYARKTKPKTMGKNVYKAIAISATTGKSAEIVVKKEFLNKSDKILIIDDFISEGVTTLALCEIADAAGAKIVGFGAIIEKIFLKGREKFEKEGIPIHSIIKIKSMDKKSNTIVFD
ncbi:MAG: xanthine phosphoribosyltransferase [Candidatus Methanofastidiosia archaeon]